MSSVEPPTGAVEAARVEAAATESPEAKARKRMRTQEFALPVVVIALFILGAVTKSDLFLQRSNFENVLIQASVTGVIAVGMTFVIATGGIDLSVGSILALAAILGGQVIGDGGAWGFALLTLVAAAAVGAVNGLVISWLRVLPFIATLAMLTAARGLALKTSGKTPISLYEHQNILKIGSDTFLGIPIPVFVLIAVTIAGWVLLNRTRYGRYVIAVGGNREAARIAGIRVRQIVFSVYVLVGLCTGIASLLLAGQLGSASPVAGSGYELQAIAAVAIGGTALIGGRATMLGTFLGVVTFALIFNLLNLWHASSEIQQIIQGVIIVIAVALQRRND